MTRTAMMQQIEELLQRVERLEASINAMPRAVNDSNDPHRDDEAGFQRAVAQLAAGNRKALSIYLKRGGKIPVTRTAQGERP